MFAIVQVIDVGGGSYTGDFVLSRCGHYWLTVVMGKDTVGQPIDVVVLPGKSGGQRGLPTLVHTVVHFAVRDAEVMPYWSFHRGVVMHIYHVFGSGRARHIEHLVR